jgi:hypothetical protein
MDWSSVEDWSYLVTVIGLPLAIVVWVFEQLRERENDEEEIYHQLSESYAGFLKQVLENADLQLRSSRTMRPLTDEQRERKLILFDVLVALFERSYILVYEERMDRQRRRMWQSWEDYMREWCRRTDFRTVLPFLLEGEDPDFAAHILRIADEVAGQPQREDSLGRLLT